jgi:predicted DNA-binding transcriptional regulator AlpA
VPNLVGRWNSAPATFGFFVGIVAKTSTSEERPMRHSAQTLTPLQSFSQLPDEAHIRVRVVAALFAISVPTVWRWVQLGRLPPPHRFSKRLTAWNVGSIRAALAKAVTQ